jgi:mono/diheme cytochrome c family protein
MSTIDPLRSTLGLAALASLLGLLAGCASSPRSPASGATAASKAPVSQVARGRDLYQADGCSGCHSLDGTRLTGPSWKALAGSRVTLSGGRTLIANDAYLRRHIVEPNAFTVNGYPGDVMAQAIEGLGLKGKPADVAALVAFIDSVS